MADFSTAHDPYAEWCDGVASRGERHERKAAARTAAAMPAASQPVSSRAGLRACELKRALVECGFGRGAFPHLRAVADALADSLTVAGAAPDSSCATWVGWTHRLPVSTRWRSRRRGHLEARAVYAMRGGRACPVVPMLSCSVFAVDAVCAARRIEQVARSLGSSSRSSWNPAVRLPASRGGDRPAAGRPRGAGNSAAAASYSATSSWRRASGTSCQWQSASAPSSAYSRLRLGRKPARLTRMKASTAPAAAMSSWVRKPTWRNQAADLGPMLRILIGGAAVIAAIPGRRGRWLPGPVGLPRRNG